MEAFFIALVLIWHSVLSPPYSSSYCSLFNSVVPFVRQCCSSCLMVLFDNVVPLARHCYSLFSVVIVPCWMLLLFLFNTTTPCSIQLFLLFNVATPCSTMLLMCSFILDTVHSSTSLLCPWCCCSLLLIQHCSSLINYVTSLFIHPQHNLLRYLFIRLVMLLFLVWHYYSYSSYFILIFHPLSFLQVWKELSKFKFFKPNLEGENVFFNFCLLMNFFNYPCFWEMLVDNVFICCVQELFGHCTFNYTHCISFA